MTTTTTTNTTTGTKHYTKEERELKRQKALERMIAYCSLNPRSHREIRNELYTMGLWKWEREEILSRLIADDWVNEERFAGHLVTEKMQDWGKVRIRKHLVQQRVSQYNINRVLKKIDGEEYKNKLYDMAFRKWHSIQGADVSFPFKMKKTSDYLLRKGYEHKLVTETMEKLTQGGLKHRKR